MIALMTSLVWSWFLNDLDVLSIRMARMVLGPLAGLSCLNLHHILSLILMRVAWYGVFQCRLSWLSLWMLIIVVRIEVLNLIIWLSIHSINVAGWLLSHFFCISLLTDQSIFEEFILILLRIGAFKRIKSTHEFDVAALRVSMLDLHLVLPWTVVTVNLLVLLVVLHWIIQ